MTFHSINAADDDKKRELLDLERIHRILDWALEGLEVQKTKLQHSGKYQRFVSLYTQNILPNAVRIVLGDIRAYERHLAYQLIYIRISVWLMKLMASLRTCERELLIIFGKTELLRATSKFARAPPIINVSLSSSITSRKFREPLQLRSQQCPLSVKSHTSATRSALIHHGCKTSPPATTPLLTAACARYKRRVGGAGVVVRR